MNASYLSGLLCVVAPGHRNARKGHFLVEAGELHEDASAMLSALSTYYTDILLTGQAEQADKIIYGPVTLLEQVCDRNPVLLCSA